ncbi:MAG: hypothetical protein OJF52_003490 [Nitrospira sp.]|jgi:hypothetical protein|nr:MAG: hypothetical protein OJF52_003490 [Nitrospira sp.]
MPNRTTIKSTLQRPTDKIDFPTSDAWRDHYAAQGLTYPSPSANRKPKLFVDQVVDAIRQELLGWKSKAIQLESRCAALESEVNRLQDLLTGRQGSAARLTATPLSGCA